LQKPQGRNRTLDAHADNASAVEVMGNEKLRIIAAMLVKAIRENTGVDWWKFNDRRGHEQKSSSPDIFLRRPKS